jgi:hypothetical protein
MESKHEQQHPNNVDLGLLNTTEVPISIQLSGLKIAWARVCTEQRQLDLSLGEFVWQAFVYSRSISKLLFLHSSVVEELQPSNLSLLRR